MLKLKNNIFKIGNDDLFENDRLNREDHINALTNILKNTSNSFVLAIDSEWGTGKTVFIELWGEYLARQKIPSIYFNAWEHDYADDALTSLIGGISTQLKDKYESIKDKVDELVKTSAQYSLKIIPLLLKGLAGKLIGDKTIEDVIETLGSTLSDKISEQYENNIEIIKELKNNLKSVVDKLHEESPSLPLVIFIDELDRCRPDYSIEILEKVKHLFNVDGIVFVLGIAKEQLGHSIRAIYGAEFCYKGYLKRFIDITYTLPKPGIDNFVDSMFVAFKITELLKKNKPETYEKIEQEIKLIMINYFKIYGNSLRDIEQFIAHLNIVIRLFEINEKIHHNLLVFYMILKNQQPELYIKLENKNYILSKLFEEIEKLSKYDPILFSERFFLDLKTDVSISLIKADYKEENIIITELKENILSSTSYNTKTLEDYLTPIRLFGDGVFNILDKINLLENLKHNS